MSGFRALDSWPKHLTQSNCTEAVCAELGRLELNPELPEKAAKRIEQLEVYAGEANELLDATLRSKLHHLTVVSSQVVDLQRGCSGSVKEIESSLTKHRGTRDSVVRNNLAIIQLYVRSCRIRAILQLNKQLGLVEKVQGFESLAESRGSSLSQATALVARLNSCSVEVGCPIRALEFLRSEIIASCTAARRRLLDDSLNALFAPVSQFRSAGTTLLNTHRAFLSGAGDQYPADTSLLDMTENYDPGRSVRTSTALKFASSTYAKFLNEKWRRLPLSVRSDKVEISSDFCMGGDEGFVSVFSRMNQSSKENSKENSLSNEVDTYERSVDSKQSDLMDATPRDALTPRDESRDAYSLVMCSVTEETHRFMTRMFCVGIQFPSITRRVADSLLTLLELYAVIVFSLVASGESVRSVFIEPARKPPSPSGLRRDFSSCKTYGDLVEKMSAHSEKMRKEHARRDSELVSLVSKIVSTYPGHVLEFINNHSDSTAKERTGSRDSAVHTKAAIHSLTRLTAVESCESVLKLTRMYATTLNAVTHLGIDGPELDQCFTRVDNLIRRLRSHVVSRHIRSELHYSVSACLDSVLLNLLVEVQHTAVTEALELNLDSSSKFVGCATELGKNVAAVIRSTLKSTPFDCSTNLSQIAVAAAECLLEHLIYPLLQCVVIAPPSQDADRFAKATYSSWAATHQASGSAASRQSSGEYQRQSSSFSRAGTQNQSGSDFSGLPFQSAFRFLESLGNGDVPRGPSAAREVVLGQNIRQQTPQTATEVDVSGLLASSRPIVLELDDLLKLTCLLRDSCASAFASDNLKSEFKKAFDNSLDLFVTGYYGCEGRGYGAWLEWTDDKMLQFPLRTMIGILNATESQAELRNSGLSSMAERLINFGKNRLDSDQD